MRIEIIEQPIARDELLKLAQDNQGSMVKGVVDLCRKNLALGGELHADAEMILLDHGSEQVDLWGFNIYVDRDREDRLAFTSFINIRPSQNNRSLEVEDQEMRQQIRDVIDFLVE